MPTIPLIVVEEKLAIASLVYLPCTFKIAVETIYKAVSYTHLTLPTTPYV